MQLQRDNKLLIGNKKPAKSDNQKLCFPKYGPKHELIVEQKRISNVNIPFKAQAAIQMFRYEDDGYDARPYNGQGAKALLSNYFWNLDLQQVEVSDTDVSFNIEGSLYLHEFMQRKVNFK